MRTADIQTLDNPTIKTRAGSIQWDVILRWAGLAAVVMLAAVLRFTNLASLGYANHYYAAAITSMAQSWHNFFFAAAEPGGSVSVDKPPVGLWLQTASAVVFGVNYFGLLFPEVMAGILSVIVLYHLVSRHFGFLAGLLAALALAITPVVVATDRNNTMDSILILTLLLGAWAFIKAVESRQLRFLMLGAFLTGVGFNVKMLEAFLPLPAFYALYFFGAAEKFWTKVGKLAGATLLLAAVSVSWMMIVDLTPVEQRPYVGSSGNNTEINLAFGYNGIDRLLGMGANRGIQVGSPVTGNNPPGTLPGAPVSPSQGGVLPGGAGGGFGNGRSGFGGGFNGRPGDGFNRGGGLFGTGSAGALRLFIPPLNKEAGWFIPLSLLGMALLLLGARPKWPLAVKHQALLLWGGWLVTGGVFFSTAGFFHEYYLSVLAPPAAALAGIGAMELWHLRQKNLWWTLFLMTMGLGDALVYQVYIAQNFITRISWLPALYVLYTLGATLLVIEGLKATWDRRQVIMAENGLNAAAEKGRNAWHFVAPAGMTCLMASVMLTPLIWSGMTNANSSSNQSLPAAYDGRSSGPGRLGGLQVNSTLLAYLQKNTQTNRYLMAVPSSMQGADYVLATGRPVLYMGGFMGQDNVVSASQLQKLVDNGDLRFIYWGGGRGGERMQSDVSQWISSNCQIVNGYEIATSNSGAPDGTLNGGGANVPGGFGPNMNVSLYDCQKN
jgi:4-amino-4-deoxy-L-arabinose transferase-like glycosyltransferase